MEFRIDYHHDDLPKYVTETEARLYLHNVYRQEADWTLQWERLLRGEAVELMGCTIRRVHDTD